MVRRKFRIAAILLTTTSLSFLAHAFAQTPEQVEHAVPGPPQMMPFVVKFHIMPEEAIIPQDSDGDIVVGRSILDDSCSALKSQDMDFESVVLRAVKFNAFAHDPKVFKDVSDYCVVVDKEYLKEEYLKEESLTREAAKKHAVDLQAIQKDCNAKFGETTIQAQECVLNDKRSIKASQDLAEAQMAIKRAHRGALGTAYDTIFAGPIDITVTPMGAIVDYPGRWPGGKRPAPPAPTEPKP